MCVFAHYRMKWGDYAEEKCLVTGQAIAQPSRFASCRGRAPGQSLISSIGIKPPMFARHVYTPYMLHCRQSLNIILQIQGVQHPEGQPPHPASCTAFISILFSLVYRTSPCSRPNTFSAPNPPLQLPHPSSDARMNQSVLPARLPAWMVGRAVAIMASCVPSTRITSQSAAVHAMVVQPVPVLSRATAAIKVSPAITSQPSANPRPSFPSPRR